MRAKLILALPAIMLLSGCLGRTGYVQSDIPGVAEALARWHAENRDTQCRPGTVAVVVEAQAERSTTSFGLERSRYEHRIVCVEP